MDKEVLQFMISQIEKIGTQQEAILVIWREPLQLYVYDNSTWKLSNELYKRIDGTWTRVLL
jgi:hypothetical protein